MKNETHIRNADACIENIKDWEINDKEKEKVKLYLKEYTSGKITQRIGTNPGALIERLVQLLKVPLEYIKQPTAKEVERFFQDLVIKKKICSITRTFNRRTKDFLVSSTKKPYAPKTQIEMISALKKYLLWRYKDIKLIEPLNIKIGKKERDIESITLKEVELLYNNCKSDEERYIISGLFSSGCRAEEFMSWRICDVTLPEKDEFIKVIIKNSTSKTKGRTISLYWTKTLESIPQFLKQRATEGAKPTDFIMTRDYLSMQRWISRLGQKVLKKRVHPHIFRHACADWLANRLNRQQMCIFFGWAFSSNMPDVYIQRQNVNMKDVDDKVASSNYQELKDKMNKAEYENKIKNEELNEMKLQLVKVTKYLEAMDKSVK